MWVECKQCGWSGTIWCGWRRRKCRRSIKQLPRESSDGRRWRYGPDLHLFKLFIQIMDYRLKFINSPIQLLQESSKNCLEFQSDISSCIICNVARFLSFTVFHMSEASAKIMLVKIKSLCKKTEVCNFAKSPNNDKPR